MRFHDPLDCLTDIFEYEAFRSGQEDPIRHVIAGGDALVLFPTGRGKSLCYQIPALCRDGTAIVVSPLLSLMRDQVEALEFRGVPAAALTSETSVEDAKRIMADAASGELKILYVSPEGLDGARMRKLLPKMTISLFAIDEAHCVSQWGHDFRPAYMNLSTLGARFPGVPRLALTASADVETKNDLLSCLDMADATVFQDSFDRANISYEINVRASEKDARKKILAAIARHEGEAGIVYCAGRATVEKTAAWLQANGVDALPYHAGMETSDRQDNQDRFQNEDGVVIVATTAFGMGIDKADVRFVIHVDLPGSAEGFAQETGRAGRDGLPAEAILFYSYGDATKRRRMIKTKTKSVPMRRTANARLDSILGICETSNCRRQAILAHFGEAHAGNCGNCDNCSNAPLRCEATSLAKRVLSIATASNGKCDATETASIAAGGFSAKVRAGAVLETVAEEFASLDADGWSSAIRQMVADGLLTVEHENRGALKATAAGKSVLEGERGFRLRPISASAPAKRRVRTTKAKTARPPSTGTTSRRPARRAPSRSRDTWNSGAPIEVRSFDEEPAYASGRSRQRRGAASGSPLFEALNRERKRLAKQAGVKDYFVLHTDTLKSMAETRPRNGTEMLAIRGVGQAKLERFGGNFLAIIARHA